MKNLIITTRVILDPDEVDNAHGNGASDSDIIQEVKGHINSAVGNRNILDAAYILEAEILDVTEEE